LKSWFWYSKITRKNHYHRLQFRKISNLSVCDGGKSLPLSLTRTARIYCVFYMPHSSSNAIAWANEKHRHVYTASFTDGSFSYAVCFKKNIAFFFAILFVAPLNWREGLRKYPSKVRCHVYIFYTLQNVSDYNWSKYSSLKIPIILIFHI